MLKTTRLVVGIAPALCSVGFLIEGGLSRYAKFGVPPEPQWSVIAMGLAMLAGGLFLLRPFPWIRR